MPALHPAHVPLGGSTSSPSLWITPSCWRPDVQELKGTSGTRSLVSQSGNGGPRKEAGLAGPHSSLETCCTRGQTWGHWLPELHSAQCQLHGLCCEPHLSVTSSPQTFLGLFCEPLETVKPAREPTSSPAPLSKARPCARLLETPS